MADRPAPSRRLPGLEMLRLVAASCVLFLHAMANFGGPPWFGRGYLGVDFFLMLSGFLMARGQEEKLAGGASAWVFMAKRYVRLWPMMALGGLIGLPRWFLFSQNIWDFGWVATLNLALLPVPFHRFVFPLNVPAWTITCELLCNLAHVTLLWRVRGRWIWWIVLALLPIDIWIGLKFGYFNVGAQPDNFAFGLGRCLFAYALGIGLARAWAKGVPHWVTLVMPWWLAVGLMPLLLVGAGELGLWGWPYELGFVLIASPLMIGGAMGLDRFHGMGRIAFPLFALQMPVLEGMRFLGGHYWGAVSLAIEVSVAAAVGIYLWDKRKRNSM